MHKGNSVVVLRAAPGASREGGVGAGGSEGGGAWILSLSLEVRHCPPRHQMSFLCFPDVTPITTGQLKSRGCGPTRARSSFPWSVLPWQGRRVGWVGGLGRKGLSSSPILLVTQGNTGKHRLLLLPCSGGEEKVRRLMDGSMWMLIHTLRSCPSAAGWGVSSRGNRRGRPRSRTSGWNPQSRSAWRRWWATGRCGECWPPSPSLSSPSSAADRRGRGQDDGQCAAALMLHYNLLC